MHNNVRSTLNSTLIYMNSTLNSKLKYVRLTLKNAKRYKIVNESVGFI